MRIMLGISTLIAAVILAGCGSDPKVEPADLVFSGGAVFTSDPDQPTASAVAVRGERIVYVGEEAGIAPFIGAGTRQIDIGNGLLISGLMDSHTHVFNGSFSDVGVNLSLADTRAKLQSALEAIRDANPGSGPVYARGWQNHLFPKTGPTAQELDAIFGDRIVILGSVDGHSRWFSSRALRDGGVDANYPDPHPGVSFFERDPLTNEPLGTGREKAGVHIEAEFVPGDKAAYH
ncbi:MAG: amidohydrolase family protein, partial [Gammaproteobacteria bacterium]|nr:amidohydrolase family protein [Gammaproteobacteria bacterium]